ncbi:MAG: response regulator [Granulosicoccus sp.]
MPGETILYVEDDEDNAYMLSKRLLRREYHVVVSTDGKSGIEAALTIKPDLILLDLNIPVLDGWLVVQELKSNPITVLTPVIAVSSHALANYQTAALNAGFDDYETKPINFDNLLKKIRTLLESDVSV